MRIEIVDRLDTLMALASPWEALVEASPVHTVFQRLEWIEAWWRTLSAGYELATVIVRDGDTLRAAAPLMVGRQRRLGRTVRTAEFIGDIMYDYGDFLYRDEAALEKLLTAVSDRLRWDFLDLNHLLERSPTLATAARVLSARGVPATLFPCDICPAYVFDAARGSDGTDVLKKKSLRGQLKALARMGKVTCTHLTAYADVREHMESFFDQHVERRGLSDSPSLFRDGGNRDFFRLLGERLAARGWLLFSVLALDDVPVAYHYGFVYDGVLTWYKPSFAADHARHSPGAILLRYLFEFCRDHGLRELDLAVGDEPYKDRFSNVRRQGYRFQVFRRPAWQRVQRLQRGAKEWVKRRPAMRRLAGHLGFPPGAPPRESGR